MGRPAAGARAASLALGDQRRALILLFLFLLGVYVTTAAGQTSSIDQDEMYDLTSQIAQHGLAAYAEDRRAPLMDSLGPQAINWVPAHRALAPLLAVPLYLVGGQRGVTLLSAFITAGCGLLLALVAQALGVDSRRALLLALLYGLTTLAWPYSKYFWSEPLATLCLLAATVLVLRGSWLAAGLCLLLAIATRLSMSISLLPFVAYLAMQRASLRDLAAFLLPAAGAAVLLVAYTIRTPSSDTFYLWPYMVAVLHQMSAANLANGLYGLLLSPGKSLFLYSPVLLAAMPGFWRLPRPEAALCLLLSVSHVLLAAALPDWSGDPAWGPRYLVPVVPFLLLPIVVCSWQSWFIRLPATAGLGVQLFAVATDVWPWYAPAGIVLAGWAGWRLAGYIRRSSISAPAPANITTPMFAGTR